MFIANLALSDTILPLGTPSPSYEICNPVCRDKSGNTSTEVSSSVCWGPPGERDDLQTGPGSLHHPHGHRPTLSRSVKQDIECEVKGIFQFCSQSTDTSTYTRLSGHFRTQRPFILRKNSRYSIIMSKSKGWWMILLMWTFCLCVGSLVFSVTDLKLNHQCAYVFSISKVCLIILDRKTKWDIFLSLSTELKPNFLSIKSFH